MAESPHDDDRVTRVREHLEQAGVAHCDAFESLVTDLEEHWSEGVPEDD